ncbi:MAG: molybdopterin molybdotransferase MoeA [Spirochaetaceae bacterium]|nr:MAG: molybdopterin molybdotransferase MoeA [Spirochaetaceae bacterium]
MKVGRKRAMLDADTALRILEKFELSPKVEEVPLSEALGRILPQRVNARVDSPPFSKAAMDGFALRSEDTAEHYQIVETIAAGDVPRKTIAPGQCSKIMTGAMMPEGADKIVRVEFTREAEGRVTVVEPEPYANIIYRGENLKQGDPLLQPKVLTPQDIGVLASQGFASVPVSVAPLVGILTTGSELRSAGEQLEAGQIYNSNGPQLCAQVEAMKVKSRYYGVVSDDPQKLADMVECALGDCDVLLLSGGVSMGDLDFVPDVLKRLGAKVVFHKLAVKPGKPTLFAEKKGSYVFGLPGNPVSTFIIFEVFVKTFLYRWMGFSYKTRTLSGTLAEPIKRRDGERLEYRPVRLEGRRIYPLSYHGSSHLSALREAEGLIRIEIGTTSLEQGGELDVRLL